jgi:hypothetical protein
MALDKICAGGKLASEAAVDVEAAGFAEPAAGLLLVVPPPHPASSAAVPKAAVAAVNTLAT